MYAYKVNFQDNAAVSVDKVSVLNYTQLSQLSVDGARTIMKWCIVDADHEEGAIIAANETIKTRWGSVLGLR